MLFLICGSLTSCLIAALEQLVQAGIYWGLPCSRHFKYTFSPHINPMEWNYGSCPYLIKEETEAQKDYINLPLGTWFINVGIRFGTPIIWFHSPLLSPLAQIKSFSEWDLMAGEDLGAVSKGQKSRGSQRQRTFPLILNWNGPGISTAVPLSQPGVR